MSNQINNAVRIKDISQVLIYRLSLKNLLIKEREFIYNFFFIKSIRIILIL